MRELIWKIESINQTLTNLPLSVVYSVCLMGLLLFLGLRRYSKTRHYRLNRKDRGNYHRWVDKLTAIQDDKNIKVSGKRGRELFKMGLTPLEAFNQIRRDEKAYLKGRKRLDAKIEKNLRKKGKL